MEGMRVSVYILIFLCLILSIGSAILSAILITSRRGDALHDLQHEIQHSQVEAFSSVLEETLDSIASKTAINVNRIQQLAAARGASFLTDPASFRSDLGDFLLTTFSAEVKRSTTGTSYSVTALYPVSLYPQSSTAQALQVVSYIRRDGSRDFFSCAPTTGVLSNISSCHSLTWDPSTGIPSVASSPSFSFNSLDALSGVPASSVDFFEHVHLRVSQDGFPSWYFQHRSLVIVNGIRLIVQTMEPVQLLFGAFLLELKTTPDTHFVLVDQFEHVVARTTGMDAEAACCDEVNANCSACLAVRARLHRSPVIRKLAEALVLPEMFDVTSACVEYPENEFNLFGVTQQGTSQCLVSRNNLRLSILWTQNQRTERTVDILLLAVVAFLTILPTFVLSAAIIIAVLVPIKKLGEFMRDMAHDFAEPEAEVTEIISINSRFVEIDDMLGNFQTLGKTILFVTKYLPRELVRKEVAQLLGIVDESEEFLQAIQELEEEGDLPEMYEDSENSRSTPMHVVPFPTAHVVGSTGSTSSFSSGDDSRKSSLRHGASGSFWHATSAVLMGASRIGSRDIVTPSGGRRVTVVMLNLTGFHARPEMLENFPRIVTAISKCARNHKGALDSFHGDHFFVTFNALTSCVLHTRSAASMYCDLKTELDTLRVEFTAGITTGEALIRVLGNDAIKKFSIVSLIVPDAVTLERQCRRVIHHAKALAYVTMESEVAFVAHYHYCRPVFLSHDGCKRNVISLYRKTEPCESDEWMYELEAQSKRDPFATVNGLARAFLRGEDPLAKARAQSLLDDLPNSIEKDSLDVIALREMLEL
jgi:hypothetical protein